LAARFASASVQTAACGSAQAISRAKIAAPAPKKRASPRPRKSRRTGTYSFAGNSAPLTTDAICSTLNPDYADLDGDGQEEVIYEGFTCMSGTGGMDFFGVVKLMQDGKLVDMPIKPHEGRFQGRDVYDRLRGHMSLAVKNGKLVEVYPVYSAQRM
jgi:hypothetical protein